MALITENRCLNALYLAFILALLLVSGCESGISGKATTAEPIRIGFITPLSGPLKYTADPIYRSFELAHSQYKTIEGRPIEVVYEDDKGSTTEAVNAAIKLINHDEINMLVSVTSGATLGVAPIAEEKQLLLISPLSTAPAVSDAGEYVFRLSSSSDLIARTAASFMLKNDFRRVSVLYEQSAYPSGWMQTFSKQFNKAGGEIILVESFPENSKDLLSQLTKIRSSDQDAVIFIVNTAISAKTLLKQSYELGIDDQLVGNEVFSFKSVRLNNPAAEGMLVVTYDYDLNSKEMRDFLRAYRSKYKKNITEEIYGALAYDTYIVLYKAIESCGSDNSACIKAYLNNIKDATGAAGTFTLDNNGDAIRSFVLRRVENDQLINAEQV